MTANGSFESNFEVDLSWVNKISYSLDRFKDMSTSRRKLYNARCPMCGDSKKHKNKARLFIYERSRKLLVDCKNGCPGLSFYNFIKNYYPSDFEDYKKDQMKARFGGKVAKYLPSQKEVEQRVITLEPKQLFGCVPLLSLGSEHEAVKYMYGRGFSDNELKRLLYSADFRATAAELSHKELSENFPQEPRIVIPFYTKDGSGVELIQGRTFKGNDKLKYITIKSHEDAVKVFGLNEIDDSKKKYCVEGPLDSLFVDNCVATCDSNLTRVDADVYVFDNQCRNLEIINLIDGAIAAGKNVVIWPVSPSKKVDINDMIMLGLSRNDIMKILEKNTFSGLRARMKLREWRRV